MSLPVVVGDQAVGHSLRRGGQWWKDMFGWKLLLIGPGQSRIGLSFQVFNHADKMIREITYNREEVEKTYYDLFVNVPKQLDKNDAMPIAPDEARRRSEYEARWTGTMELFSKQ